MARHWARHFFSGSSSKQHDLRYLRSMIDKLPQNAEDQLIQFFQSKVPNQNQNQNQGQGATPGFLAKAEGWLESLRNTGIGKDLGKVAVEALKTVGASNYLLCVLLFLGVALDRFLCVNPNEAKCLKLLEIMGTTLVSLRDSRKQFSQDNTDVLNKALHIVLENCIICYDYLAGSRLSKIWNAKSMEEQIREAQHMLHTVFASVNFVGITELRKALNYYAIPIDSILETESPVGLQTRIDEVCNMLRMEEKDKPAVAVIISGLGGLGKTTLASASVQQLQFSMSHFKFARIIFDNTIESGRASHIKELQQQLVSSLLGRKEEEFGNTSDGRSRLKKVLQCTSSFIFIDNVNYIGDVEELLPQILVLNPGTTLRILITSREQAVKSKIPSICRVEEHEMQPLPVEDAKTLLRITVMGSINVQEEFSNELNMLEEVQKLCCGIPILLYLIGRHLRDDRSLDCYSQIIEELKKGDLESYSRGYESVTDILLYVYRNLKPDLQNAFLHICSGDSSETRKFFSLVVGESALETLKKKGMVKKSDGSIVIHDILRTMINDEVVKYYPKNTEELRQALQENRKDIKGIAIRSGKMEMEASDLNVLRASLRVLLLNENVRINGKCESKFKELRSLSVERASLPFRSLQGFSNLSLVELKHCKDLVELPPDICSLKSLKMLCVITLQNLQSLPSEFSSLTSLRCLWIESCHSLKGSLNGRQLPHNLKSLSISGCPKLELTTDLSNLCLLEDCFLQGLWSEEGSVFNVPSHSNLNRLSLKGNSGLTALQGDFSKLHKLEKLDVSETSIKELPSDLYRYAQNLKELRLSSCYDLKSFPNGIMPWSALHEFSVFGQDPEILPQIFQRMSNLCRLMITEIRDLPCQWLCCLLSLQHLEIKNCPALKNLPDNIGTLSKLERFRMFNTQVRTLPDSFRNLSNLSSLTLAQMPLTKLPDMLFSSLRSLGMLFIWHCMELKSLPDDIGMLTNLESLSLNKIGVISLPEGFTCLSRLTNLSIFNCNVLEENAFDVILQLDNLKRLEIGGSDSLIRRWRFLRSCDGIPPSNKIKVVVPALGMYLWRRALHLWRMERIRKYCCAERHIPASSSSFFSSSSNTTSIKVYVSPLSSYSLLPWFSALR